jgi:hypothetical protein
VGELIVRHRSRVSNFYKGTIPKWRLFFWVLVAVAGVAYFARPDSESQRYLLWGFIIFTGVMIGGFGLMLNWLRSEQAMGWARKHSRLLRTVLTIAFIISVALKLMDIIFHK